MKKQFSTLLLLLPLYIAIVIPQIASSQGLISHDFNDGEMGPFVDCTTQNPNYAKVVNNRLRTYWEQTSYTTNRMTKGAEACGDPAHNGIGYLTYKHCWMGFTMNIDEGYMQGDVGVGGLAQVFGFDDANGQSSWTAMLDMKDGDLSWVDRRGQGNSRAEVVVYPDFPRGQDMDIIIHNILSDNNTGVVEIFVNGELKYSAYDIRIGMGEFDENDTQTNLSYTEFKIGQYNHSDAAANEIRIVDYDNISWYDGEDGYDIVNPSEEPTSSSTFIHPGITHKKSDLDRMKYMVESKIEPWYTSYQNMVADSKSNYDYTVQGDPSFTELGRDNGVNYGAWKNDIRAAYYNAIRWYVEGDERHAQKAIEIFNAWVGLEAVTSNGTTALSGGVGYIMIEAAEIIKHTYNGWSANDIKAFSDMLVFPGYSNTTVPSGLSRTYGTFYWQSYQGDPGRHGNQGLSGWRTVLAMGIFLDNDIIYDRALRYIKGQPHRSDDLPYPAGAPTSNAITGSDEYADTYSTSRGSTIEDYGYNELMTNYIWETGQCQESSRDQQHVMFGLGLLTSMSEMAWNQGDDLYGFEDSRLLFGLEYSMRYNISSIASYPDQLTPWVPTVASGEFQEGFERTGRWYSKAISPIGIGGIDVRPVFEMSAAHYLGRGLKTEEETKWITRTRDLSSDLYGYEKAGWTNDAIGWGGLSARRPEGCYGDPITGFDANHPDFNMHILPKTIEAENFDYSPINGNGRTYYDTETGNKGNEYRTDEDLDIQTCSEGGYALGWMEPGEWMTYTVYVPATGTYDLSIRYSANNANGTIKFSFGGEDKTGEVAVVSTQGWENWADLTIAEGVLLSQGVQSIKINVGGTGTAFNLNSFTVGASNACAAAPISTGDTYEAGIKYNYYEGVWNNLPDFGSLSILDSGIVTSVGLGNGEIANGFGYDFNGYVLIEAEGEYTFYTTSDDGSSLSIDGVRIVTNDGTHGAEEQQGSICLQTGYHHINVGYFEKSGGNDVLETAYEGPGISKRTITSLFHVNEGLITSSNDIAVETLLSIYPNPTSGVVRINGLTEGVTWRVFNNYSTEILAGATNEINTASLSSGSYFISFSNGETKQLIKIK